MLCFTDDEIVHEKYNGRAFSAIKDKCGESELFVSCAQDISRADITGTDFAYITVPGKLRQNQPERDGTEKITQNCK